MASHSPALRTIIWIYGITLLTGMHRLLPMGPYRQIAASLSLAVLAGSMILLLFRLCFTSGRGPGIDAAAGQSFLVRALLRGGEIGWALFPIYPWIEGRLPHLCRFSNALRSRLARRTGRRAIV